MREQQPVLEKSVRRGGAPWSWQRFSRLALAVGLATLSIVVTGAAARAQEGEAAADESEQAAPEMAELREGLEELVVQIAAVRERLVACESERDLLIDRLGEAERSRDAEAEAFREASDELALLRPRLEESEGGLATARLETSELSRRLEESNGERLRLLSAVSKAEKERDSNAEALAGEVASASDLRQELDESARELVAAQARLAELSRDLEESEHERLELVETAHRLTETQDLSTARIAELVEENASMRAFFELVRQRTQPDPDAETAPRQAADPPAEQTAQADLAVAAPSEAAVASESEGETVAEPESEVDTRSAPDDGRSLLAVVEEWAKAWSAQRVEDYLSFYSSSFRPSGGLSLEEWRDLRRQRVGAPARIEVKVAILDVRSESSERAAVEMMQSYSSDTLSDTVIKTLELVREDGLWKIAAETTE